MHDAQPPKTVADSDLIDRLGGSGAVAQLCEVSSQAVSQWRRTGIPSARRLYLRAVRPEVFAQAPAADVQAAPDTQSTH